MPSFDEYDKELEKNNMTSSVVTGNDIKDFLGDFSEEMPNIKLPGKIMVAGKFEEPFDIKGFLSGEKQYDVEQLSREVKGIVIDCESGVLAAALMAVKDPLIDQIEAEGIKFDDSMKVVSKGSYVFIGYQDFLDCTYNYVSEPVTPEPSPAQ